MSSRVSTGAASSKWLAAPVRRTKERSNPRVGGLWSAAWPRCHFPAIEVWYPRVPQHRREEGKNFASKTLQSHTTGMKITTKGQVTIPQRLRRRLGLLPGTEVRFEETDGAAVIRPLLSKRELIEERIRRVTGIADPGAFYRRGDAPYPRGRLSVSR